MPFKDRETRRVKQREYSSRWYHNNKERSKRAVLRRKRRILAAWLEYKSKQKCSHCGFSHPAALDFHHVIRENKRSVNKLVTEKYNLKEAITEAETKCIPLCSNCHRVLHWEEQRRIKRARKKKSGV